MYDDKTGKPMTPQPPADETSQYQPKHSAAQPAQPENAATSHAQATPQPPYPHYAQQVPHTDNTAYTSQTPQYAPPTTPPVPPAGPGTGAPSSSDGTPKKSNGSLVMAVFALCISAFLAIWVIASVFTGGIGSFTPTTMTDQGQVSATIVNASDFENQDFTPNLANVVSEAALPSVVSIYTYETPSKASTSQYVDIFDWYFNNGGNDATVVEEEQEIEPVMSGLGSGVIIRSDGYIITNAHVIDGAEKIMVSANDKKYMAEIVGADTESDIAVVKIDAENLQPIALADSDNLHVGDWVMAIGCPMGYEQTATTGIVSALNRSTISSSNGTTTIYPTLIQTDAAINSGNSGGALVDDEAKLIGINTLVSASSYGGQADNLGFAISSNYAISIANQIIENGAVKYAKLGVTLGTDSEIDGAIVETIDSNDSAAAKAGIKVGDVIISFDGKDIETASELVYAVRAAQPGDEVEVVLIRDGNEMTVDVVLDESEVSANVDQTNSAAAQQQQQKPSQQGNSNAAPQNSQGNSSPNSDGDVPTNIQDFFNKLYGRR